MTTTHNIPTDRIIRESIESGIVDNETLDEICTHVCIEEGEVESAHLLGELLGGGHIDTWTLLTLAGIDLGDESSFDSAAWLVDFDLRDGMLVVSDGSPPCEPFRIARRRS